MRSSRWVVITLAVAYIASEFVTRDVKWHFLIGGALVGRLAGTLMLRRILIQRVDA